MTRPVLLVDIGADALPNTTPPVAVAASWVPAVYTPPAVPVPGAFATAALLDSALLTWTAIAAVSPTYVVERAPDVSGAPGAWTQLTTTTDLRHVAASASGTPFWYRVKAVVFSRASAYTTALKVTPYTVAGSGVNLMPDPVSTFEAATLPAGLAGGNATLSRVTGRLTGAIRATFGAATTYGYWEPLTAFAFAHTIGRKYLVSCWVKSNVTIAAGNANLYLRGLPSTTAVAAVANIGVAIPANTWTRISAIVDASALTDPTLTAFPLLDALGTGNYFDTDQFMVEESLAPINNPSTYVRGTAVGQAMAALVAAQGAQATADGIVDFYFSSAAPAIGGAGAKLGDYWQDSDDGKWHRCNGTSWVESTDNRLPQAIVDAAAAAGAASTAQTTANARIRLFIGTTQPTGGTYIVGDQWFNSNTKETRYYNGAGWSALADQTSAMVGDSIINPKFDAGLVGWQVSGWVAQTTGGFNGGPRAVLFGDAVNTSHRAVNDAKYQVRPGGKLGLYASVARNVLSADNNLWLGAFFYTANGTWNGNADAQVAQSEVPGGYVLIRKYVDIPAGTAYAVFNVMGNPGTGGAWAVDNCHMQTLSDNTDSAMGVGVNLIPNASLGMLTGGVQPWALGYNPAGATTTFRNGRDAWWASTYKFALGGNVEWRSTAQTSSNVTDYVCDKMIQVEPNGRYELSALFAVFRCTCQIMVYWTNEAGTYTGEVAAATVPDGQTPGTAGQPAAIGSYVRHGGFITAPSNAYGAKVVLRRSGFTGSWTDSYVFFAQPFFGRAGANQTDFSAWSDGVLSSTDEITNGVNTAIVGIDDTALDGVVPWRRIGIHVKGSRKIAGGARNLRSNLVAGASVVRTTGALTANSSGQVTVNAHSLELSGETVPYTAVTNAVTGLSQSVTYIIYCFDLYFDGGVRTYYAQTSQLSMQQAGEGAIVMGQITIPTSGSSGGGGGGGGLDPCVAIDMHMPDARYAHEVAGGELIECWDEGDDPGVELVAVESNFPVDLIECIRIETTSGAAVVASHCTPMTLRDHSIKYLPQMLGELVLVKRPGQPLAWEEVIDLAHVGQRTVAKIKVQQRCYFAGETADATIATHNPDYKP